MGRRKRSSPTKGATNTTSPTFKLDGKKGKQVQERQTAQQIKFKQQRVKRIKSMLACKMNLQQQQEVIQR